jgi:hypothetical protein
MLTAVRNWVIRTMMKSKGQTGIVRTLPDKDLIELNTQITAQRLMQGGIDPTTLKNADQVENAIIAMESRPKVQQGIRSTKSAKVFDMEGKEIDPRSKIMGGKQAETEKEILERLNKENKEGIENLKQKMAKEKSRTQRISGNLRADNASRTEIGRPKLDEDEYEYYKEILGEDANVDYYPVKGDESKEFLEAMVKEQKDEMSYIKRLYDKGALDDPDKMATGGRAGFVAGGITNLAMRLARGFMKVTGRKPNNEELMKIIREAAERDFAEVSDDVALKGVSETRATARRMDSIDKDELKKAIDEYNIPVRTQEQFDFAQGGRAGFFMGSANPKGLGTLRAILNYMSKKGKETGGFKGADLSGLDMLRLSNPKALNKMLEDVRGKVNIREGIMGTDTVRAQQQALREKRKGLTEKSLDVARAMKEEQDKIAKRIEREAEKTIIPKVKKQLMEGMGMSEEVAEKAARDMAEAAQNIKLMDSPPEITDEGLLQLENVLKNLETGGKKKRDLNADGGRIGFKDGMTRRTFLKIFGGLVSLPIVGKVLAPLKLTRGVSKVPIIKTDNVPGKPEWFDQLVNKVIIEGDDVTKKFATGERQSIHQKTLDDGSVVRVTEDVDDGAVRVEYESEANTFADTVQLQYKKPLPDEGDPRPAAEFTTSESGPVGRQYGPDDFEIEVDEVGGRSIGDLDSDVSKLKEYATGKKLTMKEIVEAKRRRDKALAISENIDEAQLNAVMLRQGDADDSYFGDPDDFASGGIARMLGE